MNGWMTLFKCQTVFSFKKLINFATLVTHYNISELHKIQFNPGNHLTNKEPLTVLCSVVKHAGSKR